MTRPATLHPPEIINGQPIKGWDDLEGPVADAALAAGVLVDMFDFGMRCNVGLDGKYLPNGFILLSEQATDRLAFLIGDVQRRLNEIEAAYYDLANHGERT